MHWQVSVPPGVVMIMLSVANRTTVTLNPLESSDGLPSVIRPFLLFLFISLVLGMLIESKTTGFNHRKQAWVRASEADRQKAKAQQIAASLPAPDKRNAA